MQFLRLIQLLPLTVVIACGDKVDDTGQDDESEDGHDDHDGHGEDDTSDPDPDTDPDTDTDGDAWPADAQTFDVSSEDSWLYLDLDDGTVVGESDSWDVSFQRYQVMLHPDVNAVIDESTSYGDLSAVPSSGWDPMSDGVPWYDYDRSTHVLTPRPIVFVIDTTDGFVKLEFISYYHPETEVSGHMSLRFAALVAE